MLPLFDMGISDNLISESDMLTGPSNYSSWMYLVQSISKKEDLWYAVDPELEDEDTAPITPAVDTIASSSDTTNITAPMLPNQA